MVRCRVRPASHQQQSDRAAHLRLEVKVLPADCSHRLAERQRAPAAGHPALRRWHPWPCPPDAIEEMQVLRCGTATKVLSKWSHQYTVVGSTQHHVCNLNFVASCERGSRRVVFESNRQWIIERQHHGSPPGQAGIPGAGHPPVPGPSAHRPHPRRLLTSNSAQTGTRRRRRTTPAVSEKRFDQEAD